MSVESINIIRLVPTITFTVVPTVTIQIFAFRTSVTITSASRGIGGVTRRVPEASEAGTGHFITIPLTVFVKIANLVWASR